jgi:hypothetical protein
MKERLMYIGKVKCREIDNNFDETLAKFEKKAIEKGYYNNKIKFIKEKSIVKVYAIVDLDSDFDIDSDSL